MFGKLLHLKGRFKKHPDVYQLLHNLLMQSACSDSIDRILNCVVFFFWQFHSLDNLILTKPLAVFLTVNRP